MFVLCVCVFVETANSREQFTISYNLHNEMHFNCEQERKDEMRKRQPEQGSAEIIANEICDNKYYRVWFVIAHEYECVCVYITVIKPNLIKYTYLFLISAPKGPIELLSKYINKKRNNNYERNKNLQVIY